MNKDIFMLCKGIREDEYEKDKATMVNIVGNIKYDGERILAVKKGNDVMLVNRGWNIRNDVFAEVVEDLKKIDGDFILIDDLSEFMGALDQEFSNWDHHQKTKDGKI